MVGSLWAILLAKRGYEVDVYERRPDVRQAGFAGGRSINLAMSHRGWKAMEKAGIFDKIREQAIPMHGRMMHDTAGALTFQPYGQEGQAIYSVSRGGLNIELINIADRFDKVRFHFNQRCRRVDLDARTLHFEDAETGERHRAAAPLIFGADGAFSAVRESLMKTPRFNYSQQYLDYGYKELTIPALPDGRHRIDKNALHIWPRGNFMLIALPNPDGSFTCTLFLPYEGEKAFEQLQTDAQITSFFQQFFPDAAAMMPDLLADFHQNPTASLVTIRCRPWRYEDAVLLIGDASHAIVPFYGQGMNSGFEDCTLLDEMMDRFDEDWSQIIPEFSRTRPDDANAIADLALRNFIEMRDLVADPAFLLRKEMEAFFLEKYPQDFLPLYSMVTFSHLPYREALREGRAQDELFEKLLSIEGIAHNWRENPQVTEIFEKWMDARREFGKLKFVPST